MNKNQITSVPTKRLTPSKETIRNLLLRSGNECAFPNCHAVIFNDKNYLIGECCHIEAAMPGGERFNPNQTDEERRSYKNLLFLCHAHHIETNNVEIYSAEQLFKIKSDHEKRFSEKDFWIKDDYVDSVLSNFVEIKSDFKKAVTAISRIEDKQNQILTVLEHNYSPNVLPTDANKFEFFGGPAIFQFKGRKDEGIALDIALPDYNTFIIGGISGIGKTSFVANYLEKKGEKIFWVNCDLITTVEIFALKFYNFVSQEFDVQLDKLLSDADQQLIQTIIVGFLNKNKIYVVFDALNNQISQLFHLVQFLNGYLTVSKILISTNISFDAFWSSPTFKIVLKGLDRDTFKEVMEINTVKEITGDYLSNLHRLLNGHPFLIKLVSSILEYEPLDIFIQTLNNKGSHEISDFIKTKIFKIISVEEIDFINYVLTLGIPFRYSIGNHIFKDNFSSIFKSLKQKFIIEDFEGQFYVIPEFLKNYNKTKGDDDKSILTTKKIIDYIKSVPDPRLFERRALIYLAIDAELLGMAKEEALSVLSQLMAYGKFNIAKNIANELESNTIAKDWDIIYYVQGRVFRFQEHYQNALEKYNQGINLNIEGEFLNILKFEKASMLMYLSRETTNNKLRSEALLIYRKLSKSKNIEISIQSQTSLSTNLIRLKKYKDAANSLNKLIESFKGKEIKNIVKAQAWQLLGEVYTYQKKYKKAFECFDNSCDLYAEDESDKYGMNIIDGLLHLYRNYAKAYSECGNYTEAAQMYAMCVSLSKTFELSSKLGSSLLDLGYYLLLAGNFDSAAQTFDEYYLIRDRFKNEEDQMSFIYGGLLFSHWYINDFVNAIEYLGLMILSCYEEGIFPMITIMERDGMNGDIDILTNFKKRAYILIIPSGKSYADFHLWINEISTKRPELIEPLSQFGMFRKSSN